MTKVNANIRDYQVIDGAAIQVTAKVQHMDIDGSPVDSIRAALQNATQNKFTAVAGSFIEVDSSPYSSLITGIMEPTRAVVPFHENLEGFRSLSSNMYMDKEDQVWGLQKTEAGDVLVKSNVVDNVDEIHTLLSACASVQSDSLDRFQEGQMQAVASGKAAVEGGDMITFFHDGAVQFGVCLAACDEPEKTLVMAKDGTEPHVIPSANVILSVSSSEIEWPEVDLTSISSGVTATEVDNMVNYYRKVFGHAPAYFAELEKRIRNHAFM